MERQRHNESTPKPSAELERLAAERLKHLERNGEADLRRHHKVEAAREHVKKAEHVRPQAESTPKTEHTSHRPHIISKSANYRHTMASLRHRMNPSERQFSKIIHQPAIEATSEFIGKTVLRPSVSLGATTSAVVVTGFIYLYARHYGFTMRGSEVWITLLAGGLIGLAVELVVKLLRRPTS